ncbi:hypothetical protein ACI2KX_22050 [Ectopseudomonas khazarica]|uniref:Uncharacterized protein n=1 Tax=Ectopseudomonas oleovorans TaxID=301 RepID=A0A653B4B8_ECTOL|nr:conserved exported protein of unknown function [Pseudomonas oleovorans]
MKHAIYAVTFLAILPTALGCRAMPASTDTLELAGEYGSIIYSSPQNGVWEEISYINQTTEKKLFSGQSAYFEPSQESDFSHSEIYLKINKISYGTTQVGSDQQEDYERFYCAFIDMRTGCIARQETGSFCGGTWSSRNDHWLWTGEEVVIDPRLDSSFSLDNLAEYFVEIGGSENASACAKNATEK